MPDHDTRHQEGADEPTTVDEKRDEILRVADAIGYPISDRRVLGAMGHPGYGEEEAARVLSHWVARDVDLHTAVYRVTGAAGEVVDGQVHTGAENAATAD